MATQRRIGEIVEQRQQEARYYEGVDALAFWRGWINGSYWAIGVYRVHGKLKAVYVRDTFDARVPDDPKALYLEQLFEVNQGGWLRDNVSGLPEVLASLIEQAAGEQAAV